MEVDAFILFDKADQLRLPAGAVGAVPTGKNPVEIWAADWYVCGSRFGGPRCSESFLFR